MLSLLAGNFLAHLQSSSRRAGVKIDLKVKFKKLILTKVNVDLIFGSQNYNKGIVLEHLDSRNTSHANTIIY